MSISLTPSIGNNIIKTASSPEKALESAKEFESLFITQMLSHMFSGVGE